MALEILHPHWAAGQQVRGILFDMDGLVLDSEILYTRFWAEASAAMGHPMTRQQALGMRSLDSVASQAWLDTCFGPGVDYEEMHRIRVERMGAYVDAHGIALKPGIRELLDYLDSRDIPRAITSSSPLDRIRDHLSKHGLDTRFTKLCSGYQVPQGKPAPDIYLYGAASLGLDPKSCIALEDSPAGILSAYRAGCLPVMIPDQDQPSPETAGLLYAKADSLLDIIPLAQKLI